MPLVRFLTVLGVVALPYAALMQLTARVEKMLQYFEFAFEWRRMSARPS
jgi:hypothetical protein